MYSDTCFSSSSGESKPRRFWDATIWARSVSSTTCLDRRLLNARRLVSRNLGNKYSCSRTLQWTLALATCVWNRSFNVGRLNYIKFISMHTLGHIENDIDSFKSRWILHVTPARATDFSKHCPMKQSTNWAWAANFSTYQTHNALVTNACSDMCTGLTGWPSFHASMLKSSWGSWISNVGHGPGACTTCVAILCECVGFVSADASKRMWGFVCVGTSVRAWA